MKRLLIILAALLFITPAEAQVFVNIVAACGTVPGSLPLSPGKTGSLFIDTNGNLCTGGSGGGGGGNVNVTQWATTNVATPQANNADSVAALTAGLPPVVAYPFLWDGVDFDRAPGDATNGAWVNIKSSVSLGVTGTFWPYTLGQQLAAASVPVVLTAAQLTTLTPLATVTANQGSANATPWNDAIVGVNAATALAGAGATGAGSLRVTAAQDTTTIAGAAPGTAGTASANVVTVQGVASMTKLLVTPDSVALPANQSVNVAQFGGTSTATGQVGVSTAPVTATNTALVVDLRPDSPGIVTLGQTTKSASVPVALASDQVGTAGTANATVTTVQGIAGMTKLLVTPDSVALPANQSVNTAQVNGVTTLANTGAAGTGSQRVSVSYTDPCSSNDVAKSSVAINIATATTTSLVAQSGTTAIYVCGFSVTISEVITTANTIKFESGTGAACVTTQNVLTGLFGAGGVTVGPPITVTYGGSGQTIFSAPASGVLCAVTAIGATGTFQGVLTYVQQ